MGLFSEVGAINKHLLSISPTCFAWCTVDQPELFCLPGNDLIGFRYGTAIKFQA